MSAFTEPVSTSNVQIAWLCQQLTLFVHGRNLLLDGCLWRIGLPLPMHGANKGRREYSQQ
jgi:hypothetical protein